MPPALQKAPTALENHPILPRKYLGGYYGGGFGGGGDDSDDNRSTATRAAIAIAVVVGAIALFYGLYYLLIRRRRRGWKPSKPTKRMPVVKELERDSVDGPAPVPAPAPGGGPQPMAKPKLPPEVYMQRREGEYGVDVSGKGYWARETA